MRNKFLYPQPIQPPAASAPRRQRSSFPSAGLLAFAALTISLSNPGCTKQDAKAQVAQALTPEQSAILHKMTNQLARRVGAIGKPDEAMLAQAMLFHKEVFLRDDRSSQQGVVDTIRLVFFNNLTLPEQESIKAWLKSTE